LVQTTVVCVVSPASWTPSSSRSARTVTVSEPAVPLEYWNTACPDASVVPEPLVADGVPLLVTVNCTERRPRDVQIAVGLLGQLGAVVPVVAAAERRPRHVDVVGRRERVDRAYRALLRLCCAEARDCSASYSCCSRNRRAEAHTFSYCSRVSSSRGKSESHSVQRGRGARASLRRMIRSRHSTGRRTSRCRDHRGRHR
jgi:hypothetical protein